LVGELMTPDEKFCARLLALLDEGDMELGTDAATRGTLVALSMWAARLPRGGATFGARIRAMESLLASWRRQGLN
jgi:hypothetical protein